MTSPTNKTEATETLYNPLLTNEETTAPNGSPTASGENKPLSVAEPLAHAKKYFPLVASSIFVWGLNPQTPMQRTEAGCMLTATALPVFADWMKYIFKLSPKKHLTLETVAAFTMTAAVALLAAGAVEGLKNAHPIGAIMGTIGIAFFNLFAGASAIYNSLVLKGVIERNPVIEFAIQSLGFVGSVFFVAAQSLNYQASNTAAGKSTAGKLDVASGMFALFTGGNAVQLLHAICNKKPQTENVAGIAAAA